MTSKTLLMFVAFHLLGATAGLAQETALCSVLAKAEGANALVRVTMASGNQRVGRVSLDRCPEHVKLGPEGIVASEINSVEERRTKRDPLFNGIAIGSLLLGTMGAVTAALASGGDLPIFRTFVLLAPGGALGGLLVDVAQEQELGWEVRWKRTDE